MSSRQPRVLRIAFVPFVATVLAVSLAQNVGSLRQSSFDLPQTELDTEVLTLFFGAIDAVQGSCSVTLTESLTAERALAACATFRASNLDTERRMAQLAFEANFTGTAHTWLTPWQEAEGFGSVRRVALADQEYFLAIDDGLAYVIRFLE